MAIGETPTTVPALLEVRNPATSAVFATVPAADEAALDAAVAAARSAFADWRQTPRAERAAIISKLGEILALNAAEPSTMLTREQ